jgi:DamX protein
VHAASGGIPGRINALVRTSIEAPGGTVEEQMPRPNARQIGLLAAGVGVAALLTAGIWWLMPDGSPDPTVEAPPVATTAPATTPIVEPVPIPLPVEVAPPAPATAPTVTPPAVSAPPISPVPAQAMVPPASPMSPAPVAAEVSVDSPPSPASEAPPATPAAAMVPPAEPAPTPPPPQPVAAKPPAPAPKPDKPKKENRPAEKPAAANPWLQRQPAGNYVVQLYATYQRSSASQFIAENGLGSKANIVATLRDNKTWYVVVYGSYADRARARAAINALPDPVQRLNPWVRKVADLKALQADR